MPIPIRFSKMAVRLEAIDPISLPSYAGSTLRGGFGHAFKKSVCCNREHDCDKCILRGKCAYSYVFETPVPPSAEVMRKYPWAPHPFVLSPPMNAHGHYQPGEHLDFELVLIGRAIDYLPYFIYTFECLGELGIGKKKGRYRLLRVTDALSGDSEIYDGISATLRSDLKTLTAEHIGQASSVNRHLILEFVTPTRLKFKEHYQIDLEFHILIRNLLRRISLLSYFHCDEPLEVDFKALIKEAEDVLVAERNLKWYDWERYSSRQDTRMRLGGFVGTIAFKGDSAKTFHPFLPLIALGQYIHIGKGTSFGLGKYEMKPETGD